MPVKQSYRKGNVPVHIWTREIEYTAIDQVMEDQSDLVEVVHTLKQVLCVKG